jgi:hypothetical protein
LRDFNDIKSPIYILNKTGEEIFKNVYNQEKLNSYQENIYLLLLDYNLFTNYLDLFIRDFVQSIFGTKNRIKVIFYILITSNLVFIAIILLVLLGYLGIYFLIVFKIMENIYSQLNQKLGDILIKDIVRKKIDNLNLLLNFYENDINKTLNNLNDIYNNYHENYNLKIKEESKLMKKEGNIENEKKKNDCLALIKTYKKYNLFKYSKRGKMYSFTLSLMAIISFVIYCIEMVVWIKFLKKEATVGDWINVGTSFTISINKFMNNFLIMIYDNRTLEEVSSTFSSQDSISTVFVKLTELYEADKYFNSLNDISTINDKNINFDCQLFYQKMNNDFFDKLKNRFISEKEKLYYTMSYFCNWSKVMTFKQYKTIFLQLFNQIKVIMENFKNENYNDILEFIGQNDIVKIEIIFLITYRYLIDIIFENIYSFTDAMSKRINFFVIAHFFIFISVLIMIILIIFFIYVKNVNNDCKKFIQANKVFKVCNTNE